MGAGQSTPKPQVEQKPECKPCCACPDTRDARDKCVFEKGEENCIELIKAHQDCMRAMGFKIEEIKPQSKDFEISQAPQDAVSDLSFSPQADFLAASCWDNQVLFVNQTRIYEIKPDGSSQGKAIIQHEAPSLGVCWSTDGTKVISVGCDKAARMLDLNTNQTIQVGAHDAPIKVCRYIDGLPNMNNMLVTGSWDKTLRYWDLRSPTPAHTLQLPERCYTMDVKGPLMVVGCAERHVQIFNLNNPSTAFKTLQSTLKWQTRVITCFPDATGYAMGSIEGRVAIEYVEEKDQGRKFSFKCHRVDNKNVFPVNAISFHQQYGTFSTAGGDGSIHFWDKDSKRSLKALTLPTHPTPITATSFNRNGTIFAYGVGYDWHKGHEHSQQSNKNTIMLHPVNDEDIKPKPKK